MPTVAWLGAAEREPDIEKRDGGKQRAEQHPAEPERQHAEQEDTMIAKGTHSSATIM
jgi:hypothetical protein